MLGEEGARMEGFGGCFGGDVLVILARVLMQENAFFAFAPFECGWFLKGYLAAWGKGN